MKRALIEEIQKSSAAELSKRLKISFKSATKLKRTMVNVKVGIFDLLDFINSLNLDETH